MTHTAPTNGLFAAPASDSSAAAQRRLLSELSQGSRPGMLLLLLAAAFGTVAVASLMLTEDGLPARTRIAFALLTLLGAAWTTFFGWAFTHKKLLFAYHRVVAGRLAVGACSLFTAGALLLAAVEPGLRATGFSAAALGAILLGAAFLLLRTARRRHRDLLALRDLLEARLAA
jgi:hypothetical protein